MSAFTVISLPLPPHSLPSDSPPLNAAKSLASRPPKGGGGPRCECEGKEGRGLCIYKVRLKHLISAQHKFCSRKSKRWMSVVLRSDSAASRHDHHRILDLGTLYKRSHQKALTYKCLKHLGYCLRASTATFSTMDSFSLEM